MRVTDSSARLISPAAYEKQLAKLHAKEGQLTKAKAAVKHQKDAMKVSRYTPEGYTKALAQLKTLQKKEKALEHEVKQLKDLMARA